MRMQIADFYSQWAPKYDLKPNLLLMSLCEHEPELFARLGILLKHHSTSCCEARLLDVGCGTGRVIPQLRSIASNLCCIDTSSGMIQEARKKFQGVEFEVSNFLEYETSEKFHAINSSLNLMHFEDLDKFFDKTAKLLKPGGFLTVTCSSEESMLVGVKPHLKDVLTDFHIHSDIDVENAAHRLGFDVEHRKKICLPNNLITKEKHRKYNEIPFVRSWIFRLKNSRKEVA